MNRLFFICMLAACAKNEQPPPQPASIPRINREQAVAPSGELTEASRDMDLPQGVAAHCRDMNNSTKLKLQTVPFDLDQSELTPQAQKVLAANAECLKQAPEKQVLIEGHCDERGTTEYNLTLGEQRAAAVEKYLERLGIERTRMNTLSKGKNEPLCNAATDTCWAQNRRVELK